MSTNVGSIKYTVEAETGDLLTAEKVVDKTTDSMAKDFNKVDNAVKKTSNEFKGAATKIQASNIKMSKSAVGVQKGISGMGRSMGMAGIQVEQLVGSINAGQNPMRAFGFQATDLGYVLGFPLVGAIVGVSASLASVLMPALFGSSDATREASKSVSDLAESYDKAKESGRAFIMLQMVKSQGENTAKINETRESLRLAKKALKELTEGTRAWYGALDKGDSNEIVEKTWEVKQLEAEFGRLTETQKKNYEIIKNINVDGSVEKKKEEDVKALIDTLGSQLISLEQQAMALDKGEEAAFRWATAQRLGMKEGELFEESVDKRITAIFKLKAAQDKVKEDDAIQAKGVALSEGVIKKGLSPEDKMQAEMDALTTLRDTDLENRALHQEAITSLERQQSEERIKISEKEGKSKAKAQQLMQSAIMGFASSATSSLMSGMNEQSGAYKALFLVQKGIAIASTIMNAQVASVAALAPPPIGLGPIAGASLSSAILGMGYASAGIIAGTAIAGGRQFGGGVSGGNAYEMGENGTEILQQGNKNIVIPGRSGNVISNSELGGGAVNVNITNTMAGAEVVQRPSADGKTIEIAVRQAVAEMTNQVASGNGQFVRALRSNTNMISKASR